MNEVLILLPTYNERENLPSMVEAILQQNLGVDILVLDDNSPDKTGEIAEQLKQQYPQVDVVHRASKQGLGKAYVNGFQEAIIRGYKKAITMDCDFSHHPDYLPLMLETSNDYDLVLGSRYIKGGGVRGWGWIRRILSLGGSLYARIILSLPWRDLTGGFKCYNTEILEQIHIENIRSHGYAFQIETTYRIHRLGSKIKEIPIIFEDRRAGKSKMTFAIAWEAVWLIPKLRLNQWLS